MIFHLVPADLWPESGDYEPESLGREGFVHFSAREQVLGTANRFYRGRRDLLLLAVDPGRLTAELRWEEGEPGQLFPHLYGAVDRCAVDAVTPMPCDPNGDFSSLP